MSKTMRITLPHLFAGHQLAGCDPVEFETMTCAERMCARLSFIGDRAAVLVAMPYDVANGLPANIRAEARKLQNEAMRARQLVESGIDAAGAGEASLAVGERLGRIQMHVAVAAALDLTGKMHRPRSTGGATTAELKKAEAAERISEAVDIWQKLEKERRPKRERTAVIAQRMHVPPDTVRRWIKKAGLR
jgi:hypothetical protein